MKLWKKPIELQRIHVTTPQTVKEKPQRPVGSDDSSHVRPLSGPLT